MSHKDKNILKKKYSELGSTRKTGKFFGVSNGTIIYWMRKFGLPRIPKLYLANNNSAKGRLGELYIIGHPYFKNDILDLGVIDDKADKDLIWKGDKLDVKTCHYPERATFRVKNKSKRHRVRYFICMYFDDNVNRLIPKEIWVIPANICPYTTITPGIKSNKSKYHEYKLPLIKGIEFDAEEEKEYNKRFEEKYKNCLNNSDKVKIKSPTLD